MKEIIEIIFVTSAILAFIGIIGLPFGSLTLFGIFGLKENVWDNLKYYGPRNFKQWDFIWMGRSETLFFSMFPLATLICLATVTPYCRYKANEAMPKVPGYYAKVIGTGLAFQTQDHEFITEVIISFGSGPEIKAMLSGKDWHFGSIVLVTKQDSYYYNWSKGAEIIPEPLAWL